MASVRPTRTGKFELTLRSKLLPKGRVFFTFDSEEEATQYGDQCEKWFAKGMLPPELASEVRQQPQQALGAVIRAYCNSGESSASETGELERLVVSEVGRTKWNEFTYAWCDRWVRKMKVEANLAPGTIRKRVQALARAVDWHLRHNPEIATGNPLRLLPRGYSIYTERDTQEAEINGKQAKFDIERERRLLPEEEARIRRALAGEKRPDRERPLPVDPEFTLLFELILATGMRLREAYRVRVGQINLNARMLRIQASKLWRGRVKFREIPLSPALHGLLTERLKAMQGAKADDLLLGFWDGSAEDLDRTSSRLSARFASLFAYAGVEDFVEHDLRHEATCRWFELRDNKGGWMYRSAEIHRIMGWAPGSKMSQRYASFRAQDLASRMWESREAA